MRISGDVVRPLGIHTWKILLLFDNAQFRLRLLLGVSTQVDSSSCSFSSKDFFFAATKLVRVIEELDASMAQLVS